MNGFGLPRVEAISSQPRMNLRFPSMPVVDVRLKFEPHKKCQARVSRYRH